MIEQSVLLKLSSHEFADHTTSHLRQEYLAYQRLYQAQPALVRQYFGVQTAALSEAVIQGRRQAHFSLPEYVSCSAVEHEITEAEHLPHGSREQFVGGWLARFTQADLMNVLCARLSELEHSANQAVSVSAGIFRFCISSHMIDHLLPSGRTVIYASEDGDDIPNQPVGTAVGRLPSASVSVDSKSGLAQSEAGKVDQQVPFIEAARNFYLPQWVAFDGQGELLVNTLAEAEARIASMQHYLAVLNISVTIAPYMIASEAWQQKRYGMLGQLVNQGRALARYQTHQILQTIQRRVAEHRLDRGLTLRLPYFNDQSLAMEIFSFEVIPAGRIMFVPAFVVLAVQHEGAKVAQSLDISHSTRKHLLAQLSQLEQAFLR